MGLRQPTLVPAICERAPGMRDKTQGETIPFFCDSCLPTGRCRVSHAALEVSNVSQALTTKWALLVVVCSLTTLQAWGAPSGKSTFLIVDDLKAADDETSTAEALAYSEFIRQQVTPRGSYRTLSRTAMVGVLRSNHFRLPCFDLECYLSMGRLLQADLILTGNFNRVGTRVEVTLRLINVNQRRIVNSVLRDRDPCTSEELMGEWGLVILADVLGVSMDVLGQVEEVVNIRPTPTPTPNIRQILKDQFPGMVYVPPGRHIMGSNDGDLVERPARTIYTRPFLIGRHEVTNEEYSEFLAENGRDPPSNWPNGGLPPGHERHPVAGVTWDDAMAYAEWAGARLPTEPEWEIAARGPKAFDYPWGDEFDAGRANTWESGIRSTVEVGSYANGRSPCGAMDMAGNVAEWVDADFRPYPKGITNFPEYLHGLKVIRGGSWIFPSDYARTSNRYRRNTWYNNEGIGFRIAREAVPISTPTPIPAPSPTPTPGLSLLQPQEQ